MALLDREERPSEAVEGTAMSIAFPKPDEAVVARRDEILSGLAQLVAPEALVTSEDERRAFETDALTAYRKMPLAVVLPSTTDLQQCHTHFPARVEDIK